MSDEAARNVIALYASLLNMGIKACADPAEAVSNAGSILYAYLGGQAKREVSYLRILSSMAGLVALPFLFFLLYPSNYLR